MWHNHVLCPGRGGSKRNQKLLGRSLSSMNNASPYPVLDEDGYELDLIKQTEKDEYGFELPNFPTDEERFAATPGDYVKLIFRYKDWIEKDGQTITCERMWVEMKEGDKTCFVGRLDNDPMHTRLLKANDLIRFHPKHIVGFWKETES